MKKHHYFFSCCLVVVLLTGSSGLHGNENNPKLDFKNTPDKLAKPLPIKELESALTWCSRAVAIALHYATDKPVSYRDVMVFSEAGEYSCQDIIDLRFELPD